MDELRKAQYYLNEASLRSYWKKITQKNPNICVDDGISLDFSNKIHKHELFDIVNKLTKCSSKNLMVATPFYQYNFEPENPTPHHVSAVTLEKYKGKYILSLFNPKGINSKRKAQEMTFLKILQRLIKYKLKTKVDVKVYDGKNLQSNDNIGLCQLFTLFYLNEYVNHKKNNVHPRDFVRQIEMKYGKYDREILLKFWCKHFNKCKNFQKINLSF